MLMLSSQDWMDHYRRRRQARDRIALAQVEGEPEQTRQNRRVVELPEAADPRLRYYYTPEGKLGKMWVPLLAGHPMYGEMPEDYSSTRHFMEVQRPVQRHEDKPSQSLQSWERLFESEEGRQRYGPQEGQEFGTSEKLPDEVYGSTGNTRQWWSWTVQAASAGEVPMLIHPSLRTKRNLPEPEAGNAAFTEAGPMNEQYNMGNRLLWRLTRYLSAAANPRYDEDTRKRAAAFVRGAFQPELVQRMGRNESAEVMVDDPAKPGNKVKMYEDGQNNIRYLLAAVFKNMCRRMAKEGIGNPPVRLDEELVDDLPAEDMNRIIDGAVNKLFTTYYDANLTDDKGKRYPPLAYLMGQMKKDAIKPLLNLQARKQELSLDEKQVGGMSGGRDRGEGLIAPQAQSDFDEVLETPSETQEQKVMEIEGLRREWLEPEVVEREMGIPPDQYAAFTDELNRGFARFLTASGVQLPMGQIDLIAALATPNQDGTPKVNLADENPIPQSFCTNCGEVYRTSTEGQRMPALRQEGDKFLCQFCRAPVMKNQGWNKVPVMTNDDFVMEGFSESDQQNRNTRGTLNRLVLGYLETVRVNETDPQRKRLIAMMMLGIPIVFEERGDRALTHSRAHAGRVLGMTFPVGNRVMVRPLAYSGAKRTGNDDRLVSELGMNFLGWGIGELLGGMNFPNLTIGRELNAPIIETRPYRSHPGNVAESVANYMSTLSGPRGMPSTEGLTHPESSVPSEFDLENLPGPERTPKQTSKQTEHSKTQAEIATREYNIALSNAAMFLIRMENQGQYGEDKARVEGDIRGWAQNISRGMYDLPVDEVADDIRSMMSFVMHAAERKQISKALIQEYAGLPENDPRKKAIDEAISTAWDRTNEVAEFATELQDAAETWKRDAFTLGWSIVAKAPRKLRDHIGLMIGGPDREPWKPRVKTPAEPTAPEPTEPTGTPPTEPTATDSEGKATVQKPRRTTVPFSFAGPTLGPTLERQYGVRTQEDQSKRFQTDQTRFRADLAMAITGLFGFGGRYGGEAGILTSQLGEFDNEVSVNFGQVTVPDGGYVMNIGGDKLRCFKSGETLMVMKEDIPKGKTYPPKSTVTVDDFVRTESGGNKPGVYLMGDHYSPASIADRWKVPEADVRGLCDGLMVGGVSNIFSQPAYDQRSVSKEVFAALLPVPLHMYFIQQAVSQFRGHQGQEAYQDPTGKAVQFCNDIGTEMFDRGGTPTALQEIGQQYGVPPDMVNRTVTEMAGKWGPAYRTFHIARMYDDRVQTLAAPINVGQRRSKRTMRTMMRIAAAIEANGGGSRWRRIVLTG